MEQLRPSVRGYVQLDDKLVIILKHIIGSEGGLLSAPLLHVPSCDYVLYDITSNAGVI